MNIHIGVDAGSVSTNVVAVTDQTEVVFSKYIRTNGQPIEAVKQGMKELGDEARRAGLVVRSVGATGSGRQLLGLILGADVVKNEITAHAAASVFFHPEVRTVFEIGGQDSKIILIRDGIVTDFAMNTVCAAGTGSFLDHQAERLQVPIQEFGDLALKAESNVRIAGRCTVFAESDMIAKQQYGFSKADIINGLCLALVRNYINNLARGKKLEAPFVFQGGVAANKGIVKAFREAVGSDIIIPKHYDVMGAIGAAILSKNKINKSGAMTRFKGFEVADFDYKPQSFECEGCSNSCEVVKIDMNEKTLAMWGDKCGKWSGSI